MKNWKLSLTLAVAAVALSVAPAVHAITITPSVADGTYTFIATDGNTALNGSTVTFSGDTIVAWNLLDSLAASYSPFPPTDIPLTQTNSFINSFGVLGTNAWYFVIDGNNSGGANYYDFFEAQNNLFGPGTGGGTGALYDGFGDPIGNWSIRAVSTPDSGSTFGLLSVALIALGACRHLRLQRAFARR
jgi:hypothetical protein